MIQLSAFGSTNPQVKKLNVTNLQLITNTGTPVAINVLIVPSIATPLENTVKTPLLKDLPYLRGLQLANPVTKSDSFEISLLVGADHYWDLIGDHCLWRWTNSSQLTTWISSVRSNFNHAPTKTGEHNQSSVHGHQSYTRRGRFTRFVAHGIYWHFTNCIT